MRASQDVAEAEQDRQLDAARDELVDQLLHVDLAPSPSGGVHLDVAGSLIEK